MVEAADSPTMMVRVVMSEPVVLGELVPGKQLDGLVLQKGDYVLLHGPVLRRVGNGPSPTQQTNTSENGVWAIGSTAQEIKRPAKYLNAPGRQ